MLSPPRPMLTRGTAYVPFDEIEAPSGPRARAVGSNLISLVSRRTSIRVAEPRRAMPIVTWRPKLLTPVARSGTGKGPTVRARRRRSSQRWPPKDAVERTTAHT